MNLQESLLQVLQRVDDRLADRFYLVFLEKHPEVQRFFKSVNFQDQAALLTIALQISVQNYLQPLPAMEIYLTLLGKKHVEWGIPADHYNYFVDALLQTLQEYHAQDWDAALEKEWTSALNSTVQIMLKAYS